MEAGRDRSIFPSGKQAINQYVKGGNNKKQGTLYRGNFWHYAPPKFVPTGVVKQIRVGGYDIKVSSCGLVCTRDGSKWSLWKQGSEKGRVGDRVYYDITLGPQKTKKHHVIHNIVAYAFMEVIEPNVYPPNMSYEEMMKLPQFEFSPDSTYEEFRTEMKEQDAVMDHKKHPAPDTMRLNDVRNMRFSTKKQNHAKAVAKQKNQIRDSAQPWRVDGVLYKSHQSASTTIYGFTTSKERAKFKGRFTSGNRSGFKKGTVVQRLVVDGRLWEKVPDHQIEGEEWKPWTHDGKQYQVSNQGRIKGPRGMLAGTKKSTPYHRFADGMKGYHQIVAQVWCRDKLEAAIKRTGLPMKDLVVRHINDVKHDNRASNLDWGTVAENNDDCRRNATTKKTKLA